MPSLLNRIKSKGKTSEIIDTQHITTAEFAKKLRNNLNFSQRLFAKILGVSEKTIEKWEQGTNPIKGAASTLLYLLNRNPELINQLYIIKDKADKKNSISKSCILTFDLEDKAIEFKDYNRINTPSFTLSSKPVAKDFNTHFYS